MSVADAARLRRSHLDHDVGGNMATVRRVEVAREASGIAVGADIHVLADGAVESRPYDFLHTTMMIGEIIYLGEDHKRLTEHSALLCVS